MELSSIKEKSVLDNCQILTDNNVAIGEIIFSNEVLTKIIENFSLRGWPRLKFVSRQFQTCVELAYSRRKAVNIRDLLPLENAVVYHKRHCRTKSNALLKDVLEKLLILCPNLTELAGFDRICEILVADNFDVLRKFGKLESVSFENLYLETESLACFCTNAENLKILKVVNCNNTYKWCGIAVQKMTNITLRQGSIKWSLCFQTFSKNLTSLDLFKFSYLFINAKFDVELLEKLCNLKTLTARVVDSNDRELILKALPHLHKLANLHLWTNDWETGFDRDLCIALNSLKDRLESFEFSGITGSEDLQKFLFTGCSRLRYLKFHPVLMSPCLKELKNLSSNLEKFSVTLKKIPQIFLLSLIELSNLTDLRISFDAYEYDKSYFIEVEPLCRLEKLRHLSLPGCCINDALLKKWDLKKMFERLVTLEIPLCFNVSDLGACLVAKKAVKMEILDLCGSRIGDLTISTLAGIAKKLKICTFLQNEPPLIGESALLGLIRESTHLSKLIINKTLVLKLYQNVGFLPFVDDVELKFNYF